MKIFTFAASLLLLFCAVFATNYTAEYTAGNWLKVTRTIQVQDDDPCFANAVSNTCINTGSVAPSGKNYGYDTKVTLSVQNIGNLKREGISIVENVNYVPVGAKLTYSPQPNTTDGRQAYWQIGSLKPGESKSVSYGFSATLLEGAAKKAGAVSILSDPVLISLFAPSISKVGERLSLTIKTNEGQPVQGATVYVELADGSSQAVKTDGSGTASFIASSPGYYTYSVEGYRLSDLTSTQVRLPDDGQPSVAAAAVDERGVLPSLAGIFPILAAIFIIAVVALIIYNFLAAKREDDEGYPQAGQGEAAAAPTYTQKFSFVQQSQQDERIRETTRGILESRKKQMREEEGGAQGVFEAEPGQGKEEFSELDPALVRLETAARHEGESAHEEDEIEKAISELEAIREKLRSGHEYQGIGQEKEMGAEKTQGAPGNLQEEKRPDKKKPSYEKRAAPRKAATSKPKKMKFSSHGIRKR